MKFLLCLVLCFAAAQAGLIGVSGDLSYSAPLSPYYRAPLAYSAYSGYPTTYSARLATPSLYRTADLGLGGHFVRDAYIAPTVYSGPSVYSTLLKK